jgi:type I restriction enzyme S subunit
MKYAAYESYVPSESVWLDRLPSHWQQLRIKHVIARMESGVSVNSDASPATSDEIGVLKTSCVYGDQFSPQENRRVLEDEIERVACHVKADRLIISRMNTPELVGSCGYVGQDFPNLYLPDRLWQTVFSKSRECLPRFAWYYLTSRPAKSAISSLAAGTSGSMQNIAQDAFVGIGFPLPPLDEQQTIARFLDAKTAQIDALVAQKRQLITKLKEKRSALIARTVTRGLPPEAAKAAGLEPNPKMKDSGVEWLGDVPVRWEVKAIKWESPVQRGASPRPIDDPTYFDDEGEYAWVRISDVTAAGMYLEATEQRLSDLGSSLSVKMQSGNLFLSIAGTVGKPCIASIKCCIHDGFVYFPRWKGDSRFLFYLFASGEPYKGLGKMGTQLNLNTDTVGSIVIGVPDAAEQKLIADYLDQATLEIDSMTASVEAVIARLLEYRQALITSAVTGKIDVRALK